MIIDLNTILTGCVLVILGMVGFYIRQLGNKLENTVTEKTCKILREGHDKEHEAIKNDVNFIGKLARGQA